MAMRIRSEADPLGLLTKTTISVPFHQIRKFSVKIQSSTEDWLTVYYRVCKWQIHRHFIIHFKMTAVVGHKISNQVSSLLATERY